MAPAAVARPGVGAEPPQDALTYVRAVKSRFQATKPQVYEAFLEVMRDFKNARSDTPEVVKRVKQLLGGHPDLLDGFNCFLPEVRAPHTTHPSPPGKPRRLSRPRAVVVARAGESSRAPGSARRELPRGPTGRPPRRVNPASGRVTRARSSRSRSRGARQRRSPPNPFSHFHSRQPPSSLLTRSRTSSAP